MGVGYAEDCMVAALLGADMFDCVFATRTARFGSAFTKKGMIKIKKEIYADDFGPISEGCQCYTCKNYSRSYIQKMFFNQTDNSSMQLLSLHNVHFLIHLLRGLRQAVIEDRVESYARDFFINWFEQEGVPDWVKNAMAECNISL